MAHVWMTGWEHGVGSTSGGGIWNTSAGSPTINSTSTYVRTGSYSIRFYKTGTAATCYFTKSTTGTTIVSRFYVRFTTLPAAKITIFNAASAGGDNFKIMVTSGGVISAQINSGTERTGPTLSTGTWYCIETKSYSGSASYTLDWQVDHAEQTQATASSSNYNQTVITFGSLTSSTYDFYMDDMVLSQTSGDYPIGAGAIVGKIASSDGTVSNPSSYLQNQLGNAIGGSYPAYSYVNNLPLSGSAKYVKQVTLDTIDTWAQVYFASFSEGTPKRVHGWLSYKASGTSSNNGKTYIQGDALDTIYDGDMSESSVYYKGVPVTVSGSWTSTKVNALYAEFGYSSDSTPNPYWCGLMIEVDYVTVTSKSVTDSGSGSDGTPEITGRIPLTESGSGSDALAAPSVKVPQLETGAGSDALQIEAEFSLSESGSGLDEASAKMGSSIADLGAGSDSDPSIEAALVLSDVGSGNDAAALAAAVSQSDLGAGSDVLTQILARLSQGDSGAGGDALVVAADVPVTDLGAGVDAEGVSSGPQPIAVGDDGSGADADPAVHTSVVLGDSGVGGYVKVGGSWVGCSVYVKVGGAWVPTA